MTATNGTTLKRLCGNIAAGRFDREMNKTNKKSKL